MFCHPVKKYTKKSHATTTPHPEVTEWGWRIARLLKENESSHSNPVNKDSKA